MSRSLRGNVDRNSRNRRMAVRRRVVPYVGTWIEMLMSVSLLMMSTGRSLRGNVDRNPSQRPGVIGAIVVPYVGTWIEIRVG